MTQVRFFSFKSWFSSILLLVILSPMGNVAFANQNPCDKYDITPNSANLYRLWSDLKFISDTNTRDATLAKVCKQARGIFGLEAGIVANGESSTGGVFWFMEDTNYNLKIGFNIGKTASIDSDFQNIGEIIRDSNDFGQFTFSGKRIWQPEFGSKAFNVGTLLDVSYTQFDFKGEESSRPDDGGLVSARAGLFLPSKEFTFVENKLTGTVLLSLAVEHRKIVEDLANNDVDISRVLNGNDTSYTGWSGQIDISMSNNQRYFIKLTRFNDASGISGLDGTQVTVGLKIDGILQANED